MKNAIPRKYAKLIEDNSINIEVVESRWNGKEVSISDTRKNTFNSDELTELRNFLNEYKEIILFVNNIIEKYDGVKQAWEIGKVAEKVISDKNISNGDFALITSVGTSNDGTYIKEMRNIYRIFPNEEYSQKHFNKSSMCELTKTVPDDVLKQINENAINYDIDVRTYQLRAIRDIYKSDGDLRKAINNSLNRYLFKSFSDEKVTKIIYNSCMLLGYSFLTESDIKNIVKEIRYN